MFDQDICPVPGSIRLWDSPWLAYVFHDREIPSDSESFDAIRCRGGLCNFIDRTGDLLLVTGFHHQFELMSYNFIPLFRYQCLL